MKKYVIFARNWWKENPRTKRLESDPSARKTNLGYASTEAEAREFCREWNNSHNPGKLSRKAEYTTYG